MVATLSIADWLSLLAIALVLLGAALYLSARGGTKARVLQRLTNTVAGRASVAAPHSATGIVLALGTALQTLGRIVPLFDAKQREEMGRKLVSSGFRSPTALPVLMGLSAASVLLLLALNMTFMWPALEDKPMVMRMFSLVVAAYLGLLLPRLVLDRLVARRQQAITVGFPDALDLLVVCSNAGLGLNAALQRVAQELEFLAPELSDELTLTSGQLQLSGDTTDVLNELAERIGLESIVSLVSTLVQSRQFGTPIGQALRVLSRSERTARLMRTEEAAAKLATKITLPMMLFILPTVLIVAGGPAILHMTKAMGN